MKKSFYVALMGLVGMCLFFVLHRVVFFMAYLFISNPYSSLDMLNFWIMENFTLTLALLGGIWYGVWVGLYWYKIVYEDRLHPGFAGHIAGKVWPKSTTEKGMNGRIRIATRKLEEDLMQLEDLAVNQVKVAVTDPEPIKRTLVRKRAPRKIGKTK
jgi:hypothetical protein